jgi:hypothetical protein
MNAWSKSPNDVDNNGIGALYGTFVIAYDAAGQPALTEKNIGDAVTILGSNVVGNNDGPLLGQLSFVSLTGVCTVQLRGVARLRYRPICKPDLGDAVSVVQGGTVMPDIDGRGLVIAVDKNKETCDVLM